MRNVRFAQGEMYHIYNRGANKLEVFLDDQDRARFVADLQIMNNPCHQLNVGYQLCRSRYSCEGGRHRGNPGGELTDLLAFVLMPNHFHLLLMPRGHGGISAFMQKLGTAYTMYFNRKYRRSGVLFQGVFASKIIHNDAYFDGIPLYIHTNPIKLGGPFPSVDDELEYLAAYKWSTFCDYSGHGCFKDLLRMDILQEYFAQKGGFECAMRDYLARKRKENLIEAKPR